MTILFHFRTQGTGAEGVHLAGMAAAFERLGHRVIFSSPTGVDPRTSAGANPFADKERGFLARLAAKAPAFFFELLEIGYNLVAGARVQAALHRHRCDCIYERYAFFLCVTALLAARRNVPLIVEVNELAGDERIRAKPWLLPLAHLADRITFQRARLIVVVSPHLRRRVAEMGIAEEKIVVLPNAVSEETLGAPADGAAIRARHGCEDAVVIGFVGWFVIWHQLELLIAEFAELPIRTRLLLVGEGPQQAAIAVQIAALGIERRVIFAGAVPHSEIPDHIAAMDICIVPHSNEYRSPIKLFEYMARGRAVVAPRTEPIAEIIRHGENGLLFTLGDAEDLRTQLAALLADRGLRERLGRQARADVEARHTWTQNARTVVARAGLESSPR